MIAARRAMGMLMLLVSLVFLLWGIWPQVSVVRSFPVVIDPEASPTSEATSVSSLTTNSPEEYIRTAVAPPSILIYPSPVYPIVSTINTFPTSFPENRTLVIESPSRLRVGDSDFLRLKLVEDKQKNPPTPGYAVDNEPVNETYENLILVEARLDMAGMQYTPSGEISESLHPGKPVMFLWSVRAPKVGTYRGTVWLHIRFLSLAGEAEIRSVLSAPRVEIEVIDFLGLGGAAARVLGSVGVVVGSVLGLDGLISWLWSSVVGRLVDSR